MSLFASDARSIALALAEVAAPAGRSLPAVGDRTLREIGHVLAGFSPGAQHTYVQLLRVLDSVTRGLTGRAFTALSVDERGRVLEAAQQLPFGSLGLNGLLTPLRVARARELWPPRREGAASLPLFEERARFWQRALDARTLDPAEVLEADVVVVGTGAGGAAVAHALAQRGHAVLLLEEGGLFTRRDFAGDVLARQRKLYRPFTFACGNALIPIPTGISVGGTTTINSGTCYRPPPELLRRLRFEHGLTELDETHLEPYFQRVEAMLEVAQTSAELTSASERLIAGAADALGYTHMPLSRNAPGCDGQGECCFGCPTDAKRSTLVSYVPAALRAGATLVYHAAVERILHERGRAVGVAAASPQADGSKRPLTIRAGAVALACGAFGTPLLLLKNGLCNGSGALGKHLTLHPASHAWARFEQPLGDPGGVPQGHAVEPPDADGVRIEGAFPPRELAAATLTQWGSEFSQLVEDLDKLAFCGFMIRDDASRGRVSATRSGQARVTYWLGAADLRKIQAGHVALAKLFLRAGARAVYPGIFSRELARIANADDLRKLEGARLRASDVALSAFHPLGTCRMGRDPSRYVVNPGHETHELEGLFVCDGSAVPGPLGVNPQVTIMALSERAAGFIERRVEQAASRAASRSVVAASAPGATAESPASAPSAPGRRRLVFAEVMAGTCYAHADGRAHRVVMQVSASTALDHLLPDLGGPGTRFALAGQIEVGDLVSQTRCTGSLTLQPRRLARALVYELAFADSAGVPYLLYGEKRLDRGGLLHGMTTLQAEVLCGEPPRLLVRGDLHFALDQLWPWLRSFRVA
jgi:choline dehydrogenase-like flavoprotein